MMAMPLPCYATVHDCQQVLNFAMHNSSARSLQRLPTVVTVCLQIAERSSCKGVLAHAEETADLQDPGTLVVGEIDALHAPKATGPSQSGRPKYQAASFTCTHCTEVHPNIMTGH